MSHDGFNKIVPMPACNTWFVSFYACKSQAIRSSSFAKKNNIQTTTRLPLAKRLHHRPTTITITPGLRWKEGSEAAATKALGVRGEPTDANGIARILKRRGLKVKTFPTWSGWMHPVEQMMESFHESVFGKTQDPNPSRKEHNTILVWEVDLKFPFQRLTWAFLRGEH